MTIEVRLLGDICNVACTYCYQEPVRQAGNLNTKYDINKVLEQLKAVKQEFHLFGGEAFLAPRKDRIKLWRYGLKEFGKNAVQTNGTLITEEDVRDMQKYNVYVGVSIDGPGELNDLRQVRKYAKGSKEKADATREQTETIIKNIRRLKRAGLKMGIIITLHRENASKDRLPRLLNFIDWLDSQGIKGGNIHTLEVDPTMPDQEKHVLTQEEAVEAFGLMIDFFEKRPHLRYAPFSDMHKIIHDNNDSKANCTWHFCDPMKTGAVYGIEGDGSLSNCGRTNKEGIKWYKADKSSYLRYIALYHTPQENGGCHGCRFWANCSGNCPGESIDGDFRNRSINCETYKKLLTRYEEEAVAEGKLPLTLDKEKLWQVEHFIIEELAAGRRWSVKDALAYITKKPVAVVIDVKEEEK